MKSDPRKLFHHAPVNRDDDRRCAHTLNSGRNPPLAARGLAVAGSVAFCIFSACLARAQDQPQTPRSPAAAVKPSFEVASIRPAGSLGPAVQEVPGSKGFMVAGLLLGGPGTEDPERLTARSSALRYILRIAYGIKPFQLIGPVSLDDRWDINAKVPAGATKEQANLMLQSLLEERFHLRVHHEMKEFAAFNLVVAKGGLKLKDSIDIMPPSTQIGIAKSAPGGSAEGGGIGGGPQPGGGQLLRGKAALISNLPDVLQNLLGGEPVTDRTGLTGAYDFRLEFSRTDVGTQDDAPLPSIFTALEKELGLRLESTKTLYDIVVVDHIDSSPTEN
jgi:uncharacterized protein (TIGR03435 family)